MNRFTISILLLVMIATGYNKVRAVGPKRRRRRNQILDLSTHDRAPWYVGSSPLPGHISLSK